MASGTSRKGAVRRIAATIAFLLPSVLSQSVCPLGSTATWSQWTCNTTTNVLTRLGTCNDSSMTVVTDTMDGAPVINWSGWSPWLPTCGSNVTIQERRRTCTVPDSSFYCSSCGTQNATQKASSNVTSLVPCCEEFEWLPWSMWSPERLCCSGDIMQQTRRRSRAPCGGGNCPECPDEMENRTVLIQGWGDWGTWSDFLRPCSEATYRTRSRVCAQPTNSDNLTVVQLCQPSETDMELGCCQSTYMWVPLDGTAMPCQQRYCLEVCSKVATPVSGSVPVRLTDEQLVCELCEPGTQRNVTGQGPTLSPTPFPFLSTYWWVILLIIVVTGVAVALIVAAFVLCYKSYKKYRHTYYLKLKRETMQGVYGNVALGQRQQPSIVEQRKLSGTYWSNPLHDGKEDMEQEMAVEDWGNPFQVMKEDLSILATSPDEEDNLILANPAFGMKNALSPATQEERTAVQREHPHRFKMGNSEVETKEEPALVSANQAPSAHSNPAWERFDNSDNDNVSDEDEVEGTAGNLQNDLSSASSVVGSEGGSEDEEQGEDVAAYDKDAEPLQGMQQQTTLLSRAGEEPPEGSQNLELVGSNVKTFEEELTWETFEDDET